MRIMTVDDSEMVRRLVRNATDVLGYDCIEAVDGREALEKIHLLDGRIDLVLLDWNMPVMDGLQVLKELKTDRRFSEIPVTMVTTEVERIKVIEAVTAGATNYLMKPFSQEELISKILESLGMGI